MSDRGGVPELRAWVRERSPGGPEGIVAYARFLRTFGLSARTMPVYLDVLEAGVPEAVDALLEGRDPVALFAKLPLSGAAVERALSNLASIRPRGARALLVLPLLGLLEAAYGATPLAQALRPLSVSDLNHVGKFLVASAEDVRAVALRVLESTGRSAAGDEAASRHAQRIIDAFFDSSKSLETVVPAVLLR